MIDIANPSAMYARCVAVRNVFRLLVVVLACAINAGPTLYDDQTAEFLDRCVPVEGVPPDLRGSLYFAGPSLWSLGGQRARHSFDGLGRLHRLYFDHARSRLCHSARFILSPGTTSILRSCDMTSAGAFSRVEGAAWWAKLPLAGLVGANLDNTWVNHLSFVGTHRIELMTDSSEVVVADDRTLEVVGMLAWNDTVVKSKLPAPSLSTAHPIVHPGSGEAYNLLLDSGVFSNDVVLFRRSPSLPEQRIEVARIPVGSNMLVQHSWGLAAEFAVVLAHPMFVDLAKAISTGELLTAMVESPEKQNYTRMFVVNLKGGNSTDVRELRTSPLINVHVINAYRHGDSLLLDFEGRPVTSASESFFNAFTMERVRRPELARQYYKEHFDDRKYGLYRLTLPLDGMNMAWVTEPKRLSSRPLVFPVISPRVRGRRHCFIWAADGPSAFENTTAITKLDLCSEGAEPKRWHVLGYHMVAEATFVPSIAEVAQEDAGWLMVPLHSAINGRGALAIVDAVGMETIALYPLAEGDVFNWCAHATWVEELGVIPAAPAEQRLDTVAKAVRRCAAGAAPSQSGGSAGAADL